MNIYVGNLSPETTEDDLRKAFEAFGPESRPGHIRQVIKKQGYGRIKQSWICGNVGFG